MEILLRESRSLFLGVLVVLQVTAGLLTFGFILGIILAVMEVYGTRLLSLIAAVIQRTLRGIPPLVLLMLAYFGLTRIYDMPLILVAIIALGLRSSAYQSQIFRGAINSIATGEVEAGQSLGLTTIQTIRYVVLPQVLILSIGPWTNELSTQVKDSSLVYVIGIYELLRRGRSIIAYTRGNALLIYITVAILYFIIIRFSNSLLYRLEKRFSVPGFEMRESSGGEII